MADRLTVVFDDPELYRRLKVRAAEEGVAMKSIIEDAVAAYLGSAEGGSDVLTNAAARTARAGHPRSGERSHGNGPRRAPTFWRT